MTVHTPCNCVLLLSEPSVADVLKSVSLRGAVSWALLIYSIAKRKLAGCKCFGGVYLDCPSTYQKSQSMCPRVPTLHALI